MTLCNIEVPITKTKQTMFCCSHSSKKLIGLHNLINNRCFISFQNNLPSISIEIKDFLTKEVLEKLWHYSRQNDAIENVNAVFINSHCYDNKTTINETTSYVIDKYREHSSASGFVNYFEQLSSTSSQCDLILYLFAVIFSAEIILILEPV